MTRHRDYCHPLLPVFISETKRHEAKPSHFFFDERAREIIRRRNRKFIAAKISHDETRHPITTAPITHRGSAIGVQPHFHRATRFELQSPVRHELKLGLRLYSPKTEFCRDESSLHRAIRHRDYCHPLLPVFISETKRHEAKPLQNFFHANTGRRRELNFD